MFENLYPDKYVDSIYDIDYQMYYDQGFHGTIFDIDNTLVPHGAPASKEIIEFFDKLHAMGMQTCLISNNKEDRVKPFADAVNSKYIYNAHKPCIKNYIQALKVMGTNPYTSLFVGDQIFTDVWGAKKLKIKTFLVKPINKKEEIQIILKRIPEKFILWMWGKYKIRIEKKSKKEKKWHWWY